MQRIRSRNGLVLAVAIVLGLLAGRPALAAPVHQEAAPGIYVSDVLPAADSPGREISLFLMSTGEAAFMTDFMNDEPVITETGAWADNGDGTLTVTLTGTEEKVYDEPTVITFAVDGEVLTTVPDDPNFGSEGLTLTLAASEAEIMATEEEAATAGVGGVYVSKPRSLDNLTVMVSMQLAEDGTAQGSVSYFGPDLASIVDEEGVPLLYTGEWTDNGDGTVSVSFTSVIQVNQGAVEVADAAEANTYEIGAQGELIGDDVTLYSTETIGMEAANLGGESGTLLFVSELLPAADTPGRLITLALADNGGAALATDYLNGEDPFLEIGTWEQTDEGYLLVTLLGTEEEEYTEPVTFVFEQDDDTLTTVEWDTDLYGSEGLTLTMLPNEGEDADASGAAEANGEADPATLVFKSDFLPSADTEGTVFTFTFAEDGSFEVTTDLMNGEDPVVEVGTWVENDDDTVAVVVTGSPDEEYDEPIEFAVERQEDGSILAVNPDLFGEDGLPLQAVEE